jgi:hypothetical protein
MTWLSGRVTGQPTMPQPVKNSLATSIWKSVRAGGTPVPVPSPEIPSGIYAAVRDDSHQALGELDRFSSDKASGLAPRCSASTPLNATAEALQDQEAVPGGRRAMCPLEKGMNAV